VSSVCWLAAAFALLACVDAHGQATNTAKKVLHADGTVTESVSDSAKGELRESTFDARGVLLSKRIVLLNERGLPVQGVIYDGKDAMVGSVRFVYDALGRMQEEISLNAQGQVFRRRIQQYDQSGKPLPVKIVEYAANTPASGASKIDFTGVTPAPGTAAAAPQAPKQPGETPQIQTVNPRAKPEEKKGFFKKIFGK
jgi:hypothetical protein